MNTLTKLDKIADRILQVIEEEGGLEIDLSKARVKSLSRIADQIREIAQAQRDDAVAEAAEERARQEERKAAAIEEVRNLLKANGLKLTDLRAPKKARVVDLTGPRMKNGKPRTEAAEIRAWASDNGISVSPLGIIPAAVRSAFYEAHVTASSATG